MTPRALQPLFAAGDKAWEKVDAFLKENTFPLVEGPKVTWVWRGDADGVNLRHWIFGLEQDSALALNEDRVGMRIAGILLDRCKGVRRVGAGHPGAQREEDYADE